MAHHIGLQVLRAKIRGFQATGQTIAARIAKAEKEHKSKLWEAKRRLGWHCRHHLIAYGILRQVPYDRIEHCAKNNRPDPKRVLEIVLAHNGFTPYRRDACGKMTGGGRRAYDLETVIALLSLPQPPPQPSVTPPTPSPEPTARRTFLAVVRDAVFGPRAAPERAR